MPHTNRTGLPSGVSLKRYPLDRPFMAKVKRKGRWVFLGNFATADEASEAVTTFKKAGVLCRPYT
jgi:hypothetical protein